MTPARFSFVLLLAALAACTARGGTGDNTPEPDVPDASDAPVTPDLPVAPDVPVTPDVPAPPDLPVTPDAPLPPMDVCTPQTESSPAACTNGRDDDCDGTTDCRDLGCAAYCVPDAGPDVACVPRGTEDNNAACSNGLDDDCDGYVDCGGATLPDFGCTMSPAVTVCPRDGGVAPDVACVPRGTEDNNAACVNGLDDDCDGYIDCGGATPPDFGCTLTASVTVCPRDGGVTPDRPPCTPTGAESAAACGDGVDNDCNGFTDCDDRGCSCVGSCRAFRVGCVCGVPESSTAACRDAVDNDCDGFLDCDDFGCSMNPAVTLCPARDAGRD